MFTHFISTIRTDQVSYRTLPLHRGNPSNTRILLRIRRMSPVVVVVDDVSPLVRTGDVVRIRYRGSGVVGVP